MPFKPRYFLFALINLAAALVIIIGPVVFIYKGVIHINDSWQEIAYYQISLFTSLSSGLLGFGLTSGEKEDYAQRRTLWGAGIFLFLYLATAVLCERINCLMIHSNLGRDLGITLVTLGALIRLWSIQTLGSLHSGYITIQQDHQLVRKGPYRWLRHPSYLGGLIWLIGAPLVYGTWFPLLAIPGVFVVLRWRMNDEEALLISHFGTEYEKYKKETNRLIPFIY